VFLAHGYTRRELPFVEQSLKPLARAWRKALLTKERRTVDRPIREYHLHHLAR
jgi:hypothetical protein